MAHTKVIAIGIFTYPQVLEYGCCHFVASWLAILFKIASASTPSNPSTKSMKGGKCRCCLSQSSRYIFFSPLLVCEDTFPVSLSHRILHQCSRHSCHEHYRSISARGLGSEGFPYVPWRLESMMMVRFWNLPNNPLDFALRNLQI